MSCYDDPEFCEGFVEGVLISKEGIQYEFDGGAQLVLDSINRRGGLPLLSEHIKGRSIGRVFKAYYNDEGDICCQGILDRPYILGPIGQQIYNDVNNKNYKDFSVGFKRDNQLKTLKFLEVSITEAGKHRKKTNAKDITCTYNMSDQQQTQVPSQQQNDNEKVEQQQSTPQHEQNHKDNGESQKDKTVFTVEQQEKAVAEMTDDQKMLFQLMMKKSEEKFNSFYVQQQKQKFDQAKKDVVGTTLEQNKKFLQKMTEHAKDPKYSEEFDSDLERVKEAKLYFEKDQAMKKMIEDSQRQEQNYRSGPPVITCSSKVENRASPNWTAAGDIPKPREIISNEATNQNINAFLHGTLHAKPIDMEQCSLRNEKFSKEGGFEGVLQYVRAYKQDNIAVNKICKETALWTDPTFKRSHSSNLAHIYKSED